MRGGESGSFFLLTGGAFLTMSPGRTQEIISSSRQLTDDDVFDTYAKWHEGVHMTQLVSSPFVFPVAHEMAALAQRAHRIRVGIDDDPDIIHDLAARYKKVCTALDDARHYRYSLRDVIETHAVTQGFRWAVPYSDGESVRYIANSFYEERSPRYVRVLNDICDTFGANIGAILLPRLCFLALQTAQPVKYLINLLEVLEMEASPNDIAAYTPQELCEWARAPVPLVPQSLRERATSMRKPDERRLQLLDGPWAAIFSPYFDEFEAISDSGCRLDLLMGLHGGHAFPQFSPLFIVYPDGDVRVRGCDPTDQSEIALEARHGYVDITLNMLSGLEFLESYLSKQSINLVAANAPD